MNITGFHDGRRSPREPTRGISPTTSDTVMYAFHARNASASRAGPDKASPPDWFKNEDIEMIEVLLLKF